MEMQYFKWYSSALDRDMERKIYGHAGRPVLYIPTQDKRFFEFEDVRMTDIWAPWIESGRVMVFSVDTMDGETWSNKGGDPYWRARRHEQWMHYITDEFVPFMRDMVNHRNDWTGYPGIMVFGCSLGATHAVNLFYRRPDLFDRLLALSGIYNADYGFDGYMDEVVYMNSPVHYMANLPVDHPFIREFNQKKSVICVGLGDWEVPDSTRELHHILMNKGIHTWVDYWGYDCSHDWSWWYKQVEYFLPYLLG